MFNSGLDGRASRGYELNMFKMAKADATRDHLLEVAVSLFREKGLEATTMREIAAVAKMSLGSTYYYFPGKDAIVLAYYERVQRQHGALFADRLDRRAALRTRLALALRTKLEILADDRKLMGALFRYAGEPAHPLSFFSAETRHLREECSALFGSALEGEKLAPELRELVALALWALHMGILLYFIYDESEGQVRTARLSEEAADLAARAIRLAKVPLFRPVRRTLLRILGGAGLLPSER